jgi:hypothetical protein
MFEGMRPLDSFLFVSVIAAFWTITSWAAWAIAAASAWLGLHSRRPFGAGIVGVVGTVGVVSATNGFALHPALTATAVVPIAIVFAIQLLACRFIISKLPAAAKARDDA